MNFARTDSPSPRIERKIARANRNMRRLSCRRRANKFWHWYNVWRRWFDKGNY